ncbi:hypothetical protein ACI3PL_28215, partial [Lacticaseibacillus paracasei]
DTVYLAYEDGDFWQKTGNNTLLPPPDPVHTDSINAVFAKRYVSRNILREVVNRVSSAFLSRNPNWHLTQDGKPLPDSKKFKE